MHIFMPLLCVFAKTLSRENNIYIKLEVVWHERAMMQAAGSKYRPININIYIYTHIYVRILWNGLILGRPRKLKTTKEGTLSLYIYYGFIKIISQSLFLK